MKVPKQISNNKSRNLGIFDILLEVSILNLTYDFCGYFQVRINKIEHNIAKYNKKILRNKNALPRAQKAE